jgi:glycosyltransferase involved in cell wall biosynthesis
MNAEATVLTWALLTGEYPLQSGGVGDYTRLVAQGLARAGDAVHVFAPATRSCAGDRGVSVHQLEDHFGPRALYSIGSELDSLPRGTRLLVQYVPQAFGWKAMNLPFCAWLAARRDPLWVVFHEVAFRLAWEQPFKHNILGVVNRVMASIVARAAERIFVSIPAWEPLLRSFGSPKAAVTWLPMPSNFAAGSDPFQAASLRARFAPGSSFLLGHFGTFGEAIAPLLAAILPPLVADERRSALLVGRGSKEFAASLARSHPAIAGRVTATGALAAAEVPAHLACCDLLIQPYPDGVSSRRATVMAGLAAGVPVVTNEGPLSEPIWRETGAVHLVPAPTPEGFSDEVTRLLGDPVARMALGESAARVYAARFSLEKTIETLRAMALPPT